MTSDASRHATRIVEMFSDADRLRIAGRLVEGPWTVTQLSSELGLKPQTVAKHLRNLQDAGLLQEATGEQGVKFDPRRLREIADALRPDSREDFGIVDEEDAAILRSFVRDGRLVRLPAQRSRWQVVLRWLAARFQPGVEYPEPQVNAMLGNIHEDYALLRRQLVDEGFMTRDHGIYRRVAS